MAKDVIHDAVKNALIKDGWTITADPFHIQYEEFELFVDLAAERSPIAAEKNGRKILVEIKSFIGRSFVQDLQKALGQYFVYLGFMPVVAPDYELFMAVSKWAYQRHFEKKAAQFLMQKYQVSIIVVNVREEEVTAWIKPANTKN